MGLVGSGIIEDEKIINLNYISSLNFRISRQIKDCSMPIIYEILDIENNSIFNTLIVSPPGVGKTTLLKDIIEKISDGIKGFKGLRVAVIDERGEIAASYKGSAQNDLGIRTDILDNISKDIGMKMAIRSMAPKVIVADEIGSKEDSEAIRYAIRCGVKGIFTAHGSSIEEIAHNPELNCLIKEQVFDNVILLKRRTGKTIEKAIYKVKGESWK